MGLKVIAPASLSLGLAKENIAVALTEKLVEVTINAHSENKVVTFSKVSSSKLRSNAMSKTQHYLEHLYQYYRVEKTVQVDVRSLLTKSFEYCLLETCLAALTEAFLIYHRIFVEKKDVLLNHLETVKNFGLSAVAFVTSLWGGVVLYHEGKQNDHFQRIISPTDLYFVIGRVPNGTIVNPLENSISGAMYLIAALMRSDIGQLQKVYEDSLLTTGDSEDQLSLAAKFSGTIGTYVIDGAQKDLIVAFVQNSKTTRDLTKQWQQDFNQQADILQLSPLGAELC